MEVAEAMVVNGIGNIGSGSSGGNYKEETIVVVEW